MGFFGFGKKKDVKQEIASEIAVSALAYRFELGETNSRLCGHAAVEIVYLLLHLVDREAFKIFGPTRRNEVFDEISVTAIYDYASALFKPGTAANTVNSVSKQMYTDMNDRQSIYAACKSISGDVWPGRGTMVFACDYYIHRALERTDRTDVDGVLRGEQDVTAANSDAFPDPDNTLKLSLYVLNSMSKLRIPEKLRKLV